MSDSVYEEIGGREAVAAVVDEFYDRVLADDELRPFFEGTDVAELRAHQVAFISAVAGGPEEYSGEEMRAAHAHLDIGDREFDRVADHLDDALTVCDVAPDHRAAILEEVEALRDPVLNR